MIKSKTYIAIPPGATIKEQISERKMTQKELAGRMDMSEKHISHLINGDILLTPDVAMRLEMVLGLPARFWNNLESEYRETLLKVEEENKLEEDERIAKKFPYNEMAKNNWVSPTKNVTERVFNLRKYFEVAHLGLLSESFCQNIAFRKLGNSEKSDTALLAWAQKAKLEARKENVKQINIAKLKKIIPEIKSLTLRKTFDFEEILKNKLSDCGIAIIFLPHIGGSFLHGATFYDKTKIVIGMTIRGKDADRFWFSLFHEFGHVILGHINNPDGLSNEDEIEADKFARENLISTNDFEEFVKNISFTKKSIVDFSKKIGIAPGIVVGRLQKEQFIPFSRFNDLKIKYELK